ncbi:unnamed protein product [Arabidopsis arenosa]|uniref:DUF7900 domain-containing protein n=1 Tax=Arabidopsis arenosa TaxID=38785 RepID=A0A8S1ZKD7_ARAAE|nr:unnamed protein product [Arabidopsis arenosa]
MMSQSSGSDANSISRSWSPICKCDEEKPFGWQKVSLLEARDEIRHLKESVKAMKEHMVSVSGFANYDHLKKPKEEKKKLEEEMKKMEEDKKKLEEEKKQLEEEKKKLEIEVMGCNEREKCLGS